MVFTVSNVASRGAHVRMRVVFLQHVDALQGRVFDWGG